MPETRFVEGLEFIDSQHLVMSSGMNGDSHLDIMDIETDPISIVKSTKLDSQYFGEGVSVSGDDLLMMTYKAQKAFRFDKETLELK